MGFSKGSLVLNHVFAELATALTKPKLVLDWETQGKDKIQKKSDNSRSSIQIAILRAQSPYFTNSNKRFHYEH